MTDIDRFWSYVDKTEHCWLWTGAKYPNGYGSSWWRKANCRAHRVAYEMEFGPIPEGLYVCHRCDTPECVRPSHLQLGTQKDNIQDMIDKGRRASQAAEKNSQAKLHWADIEEIRASSEYQYVLARRFSMSQQQISKIRTGRCWQEEQ